MLGNDSRFNSFNIAAWTMQRPLLLVPAESGLSSSSDSWAPCAGRFHGAHFRPSDCRQRRRACLARNSLVRGFQLPSKAVHSPFIRSRSMMYRSLSPSSLTQTYLNGYPAPGQVRQPNMSETWCFFPQQCKLMGSSAQISSGVCRCGSQEGSGTFRRVPACAGVGSGGRFQKVPEGSGVCWCRFRRQVPQKGCGDKFRKVPEDFGGFRCMRRFWR